jgi:hypothetical protein
MGTQWPGYLEAEPFSDMNGRQVFDAKARGVERADPAWRVALTEPEIARDEQDDDNDADDRKDVTHLVPPMPALEHSGVSSRSHSRRRHPACLVDLGLPSFPRKGRTSCSAPAARPYDPAGRHRSNSACHAVGLRSSPLWHAIRREAIGGLTRERRIGRRDRRLGPTTWRRSWCRGSGRRRGRTR